MLIENLDHLKNQFKNLNLPVKVILITLVGLFFFEDLILAYDNFQTQTPILGLKFGSQNLAFSNRKEVESLIIQHNQSTNKPLKLTYLGKNFEIKPSDLGAQLNPTRVTDQLFQIGRTGNFLDKILVQNRAFLGLNKTPINNNPSQSLLTLKIIDIQSQVDKDALPPMPDFAHNINTIIPTQEGTKVNTDKLTILVADNISRPPNQPLPIPTYKTFANHPDKDLELVKTQALLYLSGPVSIESGNQIFTLSVDDIKNMLTVFERPDPVNPQKQVLVLRLDDVKLNKELGDFAGRVENVTHAEFDDHDARVAIYSQLLSPQRKLAHIPTGSIAEMKTVLGVTNPSVTTPGSKKVYLTFDDGPNSIYHPMILDILKAKNVKATFFLVGINSQRDLEVAKRTIADGHVIGNHSLTHSFLPNLSSNSILKEIQATQDILKPINNNQEIALFRPPYGGVNLFVKNNAQKLGLKLTLWDVDPRDWSEPNTNELVKRVVNNTNDGSDVLLHSNHLATVKALPLIIDQLREKDFSFETLN